MIFTPPANPTFACTVAYTKNGAVTRYLLWDAAGSRLSQNIPLYSGQTLLKNFRFEVWNTSQGAVSQATAIQYITSVLGGLDYRFAADSALCQPDAQNTVFADSLQNFPLATAGLLAQFVANTTNIVGTNWMPTSNLLAANMVFQSAPTVVVDPTIFGNSKVELTGGIQCAQFGTTTFPSPTTVVIVFQSTNFSDTSNVITLRGNTQIFYSLTQYTLDAGSGETTGGFKVMAHDIINNTNVVVGSPTPFTGYAANQWMIAVLTIDNTSATGYVMPISGGLPNMYTSSNLGGATPVPAPIVQMYLSLIPAAPVNIAEVLIYNSYCNNSILNYVWSKYAQAYLLPLTFPPTSVSTPN